MIAMALIALMMSGSGGDWTTTADTLGKSVVSVNSPDGSCTGFVIHDHWKGDTDLVLTAAHCDAEPPHALFADGSVAKVIYKDSKKDIMVLQVDDLDRPAVTFAAKNPAQGDDVASLGFGYALEKPMFRTAHVSNASISIPDVEGGPFVMIDAAYVGGMSGGPVVNAAGEVVSIVQRASGLIGIGIGAEDIRSKVKRYLPKPKP
jgi:S1-C subfamily serine protease